MIIIPVSCAEDISNITSLGENSASVDYYFNASLENDAGDGSIDNPYKDLTNERIKSNSIIHLTDGVYNYYQGKLQNHQNITIIGQNSSKTIINTNNDGFLVNCLTVKNLTFLKTSLEINGFLNASNVIFNSGKGTYDQNKIYGGAIYSSNPANIYIENSIFLNNYADFGGAIHVKEGQLEINNCQFINNTAYFTGGAINAVNINSDKSKVKIKNSTFINSTSINNAGGGIYIEKSVLKGDSLNFYYSNSTIGAAITLVDSISNLININAVNNSAKYDGGVIYQIYGELSIKNSNFTHNTGRNGAVLFIDDVVSLLIENNKFNDNNAQIAAGAIYSIFNNNSKFINNTYENNTSQDCQDIIDEKNPNLIILSNNYTLYYLNSGSSSLPTYYNSFNEGYVTSIKNQYSGGNCWAFATLAVLESCILKASDEYLDFSEENMKNIASIYSPYGWDMETNSGGYDDMALGYLTSWLGPVLEKDGIYSDSTVLSPVLDSILHVQNIKFLKRSSYTDINHIKQAIIDYGAVFSGIFMIASYDSNIESYSQYSIHTTADHAVSIIGWDDNIQIKGAPGKGAWIAKNSWGDNWGDDGYFYVSYYDKSCIPVGVNEAAVTFILNDTLKYDKNYQYDLAKTDYYYFSKYNTIWYKNIFKATDNEYLAAVSTYFDKDTNWELYIYVNNNLKLTKTGFSQSSYQTIELGEFIPLKKDDVFEIIFKINVNGDVGVPISEKISLNNNYYTNGISYISYNGKNWIDLYDLSGTYPDHTYDSQVACIKAFTIFDEINTTLTLNIKYTGYNPVEISANVLNQYSRPVNGGYVVFNLSGEIIKADVKNGVAKVIHNFERGLNNIEAEYNACGFISSNNNTTIFVDKHEVNMTCNIHVERDNVIFNINISKNVLGNVIINIDGKNHIFTIGNAELNDLISNLDYGNHNIKITLDYNLFICPSQDFNFTVLVKKTQIIISDLTTVSLSNANYKIKLVDINGLKLINKPISYTLNGKTETRITNGNGEIVIPINVVKDTFLKAQFFDDKDYIASSAMSKIKILPRIISNKDVVGYTAYKTIYKFRVYNDNLKFSKGLKVTVKVNKKSYTLTTDKNGYVTLSVVLKKGTYTVTATYKWFKVSNKITVKQSLITKNINVKKGKTIKFTAKLLNSKGKVYKNKKITFKFKGKLYKVKTNNKGIATLKINKKYGKGKYNIITTFSKIKVSNKIIIK